MWHLPLPDLHGFITGLTAVLHGTFHHRQLDHTGRHWWKNTSTFWWTGNTLQSVELAVEHTLDIPRLKTDTAAALTWLLFHGIQDPLDDIVQFRWAN